MVEFKTSPEFWHYVQLNDSADTLSLRLKKESLEFDKNLAITQIECRQKLKSKIPDILALPEFLFPNTLSAEQCTCQEVAKYHSSLFSADDTVLDMTGGLGIDDYFISAACKHLTTLEINEETASAAAHNFKQLRKNMTVINTDCRDFITSTDQVFSKIFIDPARRGEANSRLFGFTDCQPDVLALLPEIRKHCSQLLIKASPMLDISQCLKQLPCVKQISVLSVRNDCKEVLFILDFSQEQHEITIATINFTANGAAQQFTTAWPETAPEPLTDFPQPGDILFEPNAAIMKSGAFATFAQRFGLRKIHKHSHLFFAQSNENASEVPARAFEITEIIPFKDKEIKNLAKRLPKANVATRNFRLAADALKKKLRIADGGDTYIFATTLPDNTQALIITRKF